MTPDQENSAWLKRAHILNQMYSDTDRPEPPKSAVERQRTCKGCGETYTATSNYFYCSETCRKRAALETP